MNKIRKGFLAMLSAAAVMLSAVPGTFSAAEEAEIPDWIPRNFAEVLDFSNTYGSTHIGKGVHGDVACVIFPEYYDEKYEVKVPFGTEILYRERIVNEDNRTYEVVACVNNCMSPQDFDVSLYHGEKMESSYSFRSDGSSRLTETDIYSWAPDCITEYNEYREQHGIISAENGFVAFCASWNPFSILKWKITQNDEIKLAEFMTVNCTENPDVYRTDSDVDKFVIYKPEKSGEVNVRFDYYLDNEYPEITASYEKNYVISEDLSTIELKKDGLGEGVARITFEDSITGELVDLNGANVMLIPKIGEKAGEENGSPIYVYVDRAAYTIDTNPMTCDLAEYADYDLFEYSIAQQTLPAGNYLTDEKGTVVKYPDGSMDIVYKLDTYIAGDLNNDNELAVSDIVALQNLLLGKEEKDAVNWVAADFTRDGVLDAFDLVMMRKALLGKLESESTEMKFEVSYGGYGVAGQDLGHGTFTNTYEAADGDAFYERSSGKWERGVKGRVRHGVLILEIERITDEGVMIKTSDYGNVTRKLVEFGSEEVIMSQITVNDGINYFYRITFTKKAPEL